MTAFNIIILIVGSVLVISGIAATESDNVILVTALAGVARAVPHADANVQALGIVMAIFGLLAIVSILPSVSLPIRLIMLIPQQIICALQLWSVSHTIMIGTYPDGYTPPHDSCWLLGGHGSCFILADQSLTFIVALVHTIFIIKLVAHPEVYMHDPKMV
jgi:hypothetical protein